VSTVDDELTLVETPTPAGVNRTQKCRYAFRRTLALLGYSWGHSALSPMPADWRQVPVGYAHVVGGTGAHTGFMG
jgi:hypothetical protein